MCNKRTVRPPSVVRLQLFSFQTSPGPPYGISEAPSATTAGVRGIPIIRPFSGVHKLQKPLDAVGRHRPHRPSVAAHRPSSSPHVQVPRQLDMCSGEGETGADGRGRTSAGPWPCTCSPNAPSAPSSPPPIARLTAFHAQQEERYAFRELDSGI